jgi:hypothetical protein
MIKQTGKWFLGLSRLGKAGVLVASVFGISAVSSIGNGPQHHANVTLNSAKATTVQSPPARKVDVVTHKTVMSTEAVPFTSSTVNTASLSKGVTKTQVEGVDGIRTHTFDVTLTNGVETSRQEVSNDITLQPTNKIIAAGTYTAPQPSCPNGTYVNTYGNTVCSPYVSSSAPAGATAKCVDGTYSFSQSRSGTCSRHGGVADWL